MALIWFTGGVLVGLLVAWAAEYAVDWRFRQRDEGLNGAAAIAMQAALEQAEKELVDLRHRLAAEAAASAQPPEERDGAA